METTGPSQATCQVFESWLSDYLKTCPAPDYLKARIGLELLQWYRLERGVEQKPSSQWDYAGICREGEEIFAPGASLVVVTPLDVSPEGLDHFSCCPLCGSTTGLSRGKRYCRNHSCLYWGRPIETCCEGQKG